MHPGQIAFFEFKYARYGKSLLSTSNGDLREIYIWDVYNRGVIEQIDNKSPDTPDLNLQLPKNYEIENMRWSNVGYQLYVSMKDEEDGEDCMLGVYEVPSSDSTAQEPITPDLEDGSRLLKPKKRSKNSNSLAFSVKLPLNISYFCMDDKNANILYASSNGKRLIMDLRDPRSYLSLNYPETSQSHFADSDIMVEYNQNNYLLFVDRLNKNIVISDIRQVR